MGPKLVAKILGDLKLTFDLLSYISASVIVGALAFGGMMYLMDRMFLTKFWVTLR